MTETNPEPRDDQAADPADAEDAAASSPTAASEDRIKDLEAEIADLKDRLLRAVAETENVRKRAEREKSDTAKYAIAPFARDLVPVADNLSRALKAITADQRENQMVQTLCDGVTMIETELLATLERHGVKRIVPKGEPFDPNFHQAVAELVAPDAAPGSVIEVMEAGYVLGDRLIRPAMVVIAKAEPKAGPAPAGGNVDTKA